MNWVLVNSVLVIARLLLAAVFGVSGVAKLADLRGARKSIGDFGVPAPLAMPAAVLLSLFELACSIGLLTSRWAWWSAAAVLGMLVAFILAMSVNLARGRSPDCHCFGQLHSEPIGWKTISRNVLLAAVASLVVFREPGQAPIGILAWLQELGRFELAVLAGTAVAVLQFWFSVHILRQNGRLMLRLDTLEAQLGQSGRPAPPPPGLPVNTAAPDFPLTALDGGAVTLGSLNDIGKPLVLVFSEPECSLCDTLMPELAQWQKEFKDRIWIGMISRGSAEANRAKTAKHQVENVLLQKDREAASAYLVEGTPSAVLVKGGLIASPAATGAEEIRKLVSRATLPPPVQKGDLVPSLRLADLTGKSLDLASLRGRWRLLLFWNPTCGFCQRMLPDVKKWESDPPHNAPELVIISAGSFDANLQQGFRSRVLLDPNSGAGYVFRSGGTPSAVLIDEDGRIASDVGVGAKEVFALTGSAPAVRPATAVNGGSLPA